MVRGVATVTTANSRRPRTGAEIGREFNQCGAVRSRVTSEDVAGCVVCGRAVQTTGNTLDGYEARGNLCERCNRDELRARGLGVLADKDERDARLARLFWRCTVHLQRTAVKGLHPFE